MGEDVRIAEVADLDVLSDERDAEEQAPARIALSGGRSGISGRNARSA
jgi:hypothetical protein